ncbi:MAG: lipopolysaccharide biosynthesis protein [Chitinispirillales bacterium]|jgi:O-antigen/teichoic acid export membrane protein|nr:lipopolysaccharide biosynthesis protein [Chitinispirillales bacterium]
MMANDSSHVSIQNTGTENGAAADISKKTTRGLVWTLTEMLGNYGITFLVTIYLAHLLSPKDYGLIGLVTAIIGITFVIIDGGFGVTLIRKKNVTETDYNTMFYTNMGVSVLAYIAVYFLAAPLMAKFYNDPQLTNLIRLVSLIFIFHAMYIIQCVDLRRKMNFNKMIFITLPPSIISGITAILLARMGFGVTSLAVKMLLQYFIMMVLYWALVGWRPKLEFCWNTFKELFGSGSRYMASSILWSLHSNINPLVIGKLFSAQILGYYTFTLKIEQMAAENIVTAIQKVSFPAFAKVQDDAGILRRGCKQIMQSAAAIIFPLMTILAVMAEPLFRLILNEKWLPAIPYLRIMCITGALYPLYVINLNITQVKATPGQFTKINSVYAFSLVSVLFILAPFGIEFFLIGQVLLSAAVIVFLAFFNTRFIDYPIRAQLTDIAPVALSSFVMGGGGLFFDGLLWKYKHAYRSLSACRGLRGLYRRIVFFQSRACSNDA